MLESEAVVVGEERKKERKKARKKGRKREIKKRNPNEKITNTTCEWNRDYARNDTGRK